MIGGCEFLRIVDCIRGGYPMSQKSGEGVSPYALVTKKIFIATLLSVTLAIYGCASLQASMAQNPKLAALICGGGGAAIGAGLGALLSSGDRALGAGIGGAAGGATAAAICFTVAKFSSTPIRDYQQTQATTGYQPRQGTVVHVESFTVDPTTVSPGQKLTFTGEYSVMTPDRNTDLPVVENVIYSYYDETEKQWKEVGRTRNPITIKPGTRRITPTEVTAPKEPPARQVQFALQVAHNNVSDQKDQGVFMAMPQVSAARGISQVAFEVGNDEVRVASSR
jgi:hypothetical protein